VTNGAAYGAGLVVDFYHSTNGGVDWTYFASSTTDSGGIAQATFVAQQNGAYDFKATVTIP
jgi:hypothetical protein